MYKFHSVKHATSTYHFLFAISAIFKGNITARILLPSFYLIKVYKLKVNSKLQKEVHSLSAQLDITNVNNFVPCCKTEKTVIHNKNTSYIFPLRWLPIVFGPRAS